MLTLLTATGCRPEAFPLLERMMARQTYRGPVLWLVVDDGEAPQAVSFEREGWEVKVIRPLPYWQPGQNTQARNLLAGLKYVQPNARLLVIEDDDHYAADWLEICNTHLDRASLVGETRARYYNVKARVGRELVNDRHASLCATAMRGRAIEAFKASCVRNQKFIDLDLWKTYRDSMLFTGHRVVGIKGLPGRGGIGMGHQPSFRGKMDPDGSLLRAWMGADAGWYL